jgi:hypothetical protein
MAKNTLRLYMETNAKLIEAKLEMEKIAYVQKNVIPDRENAQAKKKDLLLVSAMALIVHARLSPWAKANAAWYDETTAALNDITKALREK